MVGSLIQLADLKEAPFRKSLRKLTWSSLNPLFLHQGNQTDEDINALCQFENFVGACFQEMNTHFSCCSVECVTFLAFFLLEHLRILLATVHYRSIKISYPSPKLVSTIADCLTNRKNPIFFTLRKLSLGKVSYAVPSAVLQKVKCW